MKPAAILVIIVNYRTPDLALNAVAALADEARGRGDTQVVLVDNGSADGSAERIADGIPARGLGDICTAEPIADNRGFAAGNNRGLDAYRRTSGGALPDTVWLLNPDTIPQPGAITALVDFLAAHPDAGIAGGRCLWEDGGVRHSAFRFHSPRTELTAAVGFGPVTRLLGNRQVAVPIADVPTRVDWVSGSSLMLRRAVIEALGPMDEGYFLYFEEADYCARAADAGFGCWYVPASRIVHIGGQATGVTGQGRTAMRRPRYWFFARARFFLHRYGGAQTHLANLLWLLGYPLGGAIAALRGKRRDDPPRFWRDFLTHYYGPGGLMYRTREVAA
jgi:N-acetylglucosaminyl-diphospho-decaprenol L-rhamnosyltransferase